VNNPLWRLCMWLTLYTDTHQHPAESAAELRLRWGNWKCNTDDSCPYGSLSADWTGCCCCTVNKRLQLLHESG